MSVMKQFQKKTNEMSKKTGRKMGSIGAEYSNKHAGAHANKSMQGQIVAGESKACK